jgi:hypothetical protein
MRPRLNFRPLARRHPCLSGDLLTNAITLRDASMIELSAARVLRTDLSAVLSDTGQLLAISSGILGGSWADAALTPGAQVGVAGRLPRE